MEPFVKHSIKVAKTIPFSPRLHTTTKALFCTITSTGDKVDSTSTKKKKTEEKKEGEESGYGHPQRKPGESAKSAHSEWEKSGSSSAHEEKLEDTGFDMSKRTKPSGDE